MLIFLFFFATVNIVKENRGERRGEEIGEKNGGMIQEKKRQQFKRGDETKGVQTEGESSDRR